MTYFCPACGKKSLAFKDKTGIYIARDVWASTYACKECGLEILMNPEYDNTWED